MFVNQTRAEKAQSVQYRKTGRSSGSAGHRNYAGSRCRGGGVNAPPPSLSSNTSFKKASNVQGVQTRVSSGGVNLESSDNVALAANGAHPQSHGGADAQVGVKPAVVPSQKSTWGVPEAPAANVPAISSSTMAPSTPVKGGGFPLQFGSISPGLMQVPARTSSAPPNLDEQKREQARYNSSKAAPVLPTQSIPKQHVPTNKSVTTDQSSAVDGHSVSKARRDVQVTAGPQTILTDLGTETDLLNGSKSDDNDKKSHSLLQNQSTSGSPSSLQNVENLNSPPLLEAAPAQVNVRELVTTGAAIDLKTDSTEAQGTCELAKKDGVDSVKISADRPVPNKPQYEAFGTQERRLFDESEANATGYVKSSKSISPRLSGNSDHIGSLVVDVQGEQKLEKEPVFLREGEADGDLSTSTSGEVDCLITETSSLSLGTRISHDGDKSSASDASTNKDVAVGKTEGSSTVTSMVDQKSHILSVTSHSELPCATVVADSDSTELRSSSTDSKDKPVLEANISKNTIARGKKKRKEALQKAERAGTTADLYMAYEGTDEKKDTLTYVESSETTSSHPKEMSSGISHEEAPNESKAELDDWENAADLSTPKLERNVDRSMERSRSGRRGSGMNDDEKWSKVPGPLPSGLDMGYGSHGNNVVFQPRGNFGVLKSPRPQILVMYSGVLSGPVQYMNQQYGIQRTNSDAEKWKRTNSFQRDLIPSSRTPSQMMHKAERKYEVGKVTDKEQAKQRQLKGILNKLTPQNFERLFEQVKQVNIDNAGTLCGLVSQIFDKALMEPTYCEMYANFCYYLAGWLPDFNEDNEKITFKRLLSNKCQEEFERGEREQEEANRTEGEGETKQTDEEREEKRVQARRRMLGNIRLLGELYKKKMFTERIMHECITKLLGEYQNSDEEDIEALCELMRTIGEMIDHPKAKVRMDAYFDMMGKLSNNMKLSSRVRFMLKDSIDLRRNRWQQRRKVEGPKKIEEVHRDAANERQAQANRLTRGLSMNSSFRRGQQPMDFAPRGSNVFLSPNAQLGGFRGVPQTPRGYPTQDIRTDERHHFDNRILSVPLTQRPLGNDSITLGPQGGLARGMSIRGQPSMSNIPFSDMHSSDFRRTTTGNGYGSVSDRPAYASREEHFPRIAPDRFSSPAAPDHMNLKDGNLIYGNREVRDPDQVSNRSRPNTPQTRSKESSSVENIPPEKVLPEEQLRKMSMETIKEFYSAKDEKEVTLCVKDLKAPGFYSSMIYIWITDSFERKDMERDLLAKLLINLAKSRDALLSQTQLVEGFESVLASLEDAVTDAPKAPEFLGSFFAKVVLENVLPLAEIGRLIFEGGEEQGQLVDSGLAAKVIGRVLEIIRIEKGETVMKEICTRSGLRLENFRPPNSKRALSLDQFI